MANRLKIYACSGIGDSTENAPDRLLTSEYELFGTNTLTNTQAVNSLIAKINYAVSLANVTKRFTVKEQKSLLDDADLYTVCLYYAMFYSGNPEKLAVAGIAIGNLVRENVFECDSLDMNVRDQRLEDIYNKLDYEIETLTGDAKEIGNPDFVAWWKANVIEKNKVAISAERAEMIHNKLKDQIEVRGLGKIDPRWREDKDLAWHLTEGAKYFVYRYFTEEQLNKLPDLFREKSNYQFKVYNYIKDRFVPLYGDKDDLNLLIRTGIQNQLHDTPENVCRRIVEGKRKPQPIGCGISMAMATIITAVISAVVAIIAAICNAVAQSNEARYKALDDQIIEDGAANSEDFAGFDLKSPNKLLTTLLIGAGAWLVLKK